MSKVEKLHSILVCPENKTDTLDWSNEHVRCAEAGHVYPILHGAPALVRSDSPFRKYAHQYNPEGGRRRSWRTPEARLWSRRSVKVLADLLHSGNIQSDGRVCVNIGAGIESVFRELFSKYDEIIRIGLPHTDRVDALGDLMDLPIRDESVDVLTSSSVLEHVPDPEKAVSEMFRVLKPGGRVYSEVPFMRGFHMEPVDYQRYTYSGIQALFERNGFRIVEVGVCSGVGTAMSLFLSDFARALSRSRGIKRFHAINKVILWMLTWILQPLKYFDRFQEQSHMARVLACNFFVLAEKPARDEEDQSSKV